MNINKQINQTLYAYLNINHPLVAWEVAIGRIKSSTEITISSFGISLWQYSLLKSYANSGKSINFINELKLELIRKKYYPNNVSRLQGIYFFENEQDAINALDRWNMPEKKKYISAVNFSSEKLTRVDSEWITWNLGNSEKNDWMHSYLKGEVYGSRPLTEILATGIGFIQNKELRIEAYKNIYENWPSTTPLLAMACCSFAKSGLENIALMKPALISDKNKIIGRFYIYMQDLTDKEKEIKNAIDICKQEGNFPRYVLPNDPDIFFTIPDLRSLDFEIFEFENEQASIILSDIHK